MLKAGTKATDFEAVRHDGETFRLSENLGRGPLALYFYTGAYGLL